MAEWEYKRNSCRKGTLGAVLGALAGGVVLAFCHSLGVVAAAAGFLVGYLAKQGYRLLKGRQCSLQTPILLIVTALMVIVATLVGYRLNWVWKNGNDSYLFSLYMEYAVQTADFGIRMLMGMLFGTLGALNIGPKK